MLQKWTFLMLLQKHLDNAEKWNINAAWQSEGMADRIRGESDCKRGMYSNPLRTKQGEGIGE